ncbi:MAG: hypothetical protein IJP98_03885 [Clostridia bacterium]|nr:hypothetical protein [Clostridia bacterium]
MEHTTVKTNTACVLHNSRTCALLNQRMCEDCPVHRNGPESAEQTAQFVEQFESLLPEGGVAPLFESKTCTLCKTEPKGKRSSYAIIDFGHSEPKQLVHRRLLQKQGVGFMVPLQFACCHKCRRRFLLHAYLPLLAPVVLVALTLPALMIPHWIESLRAAASWLPLLIAVLAAGIGYAVGKILQRELGKRFEQEMYFDLLQHPASQAMLEKGWFPLFGEKKPRPVFSRKRIRYGLGNAPSSRKIAENSENIPENGAESD